MAGWCVFQANLRRLKPAIKKPPEGGFEAEALTYFRPAAARSTADLSVFWSAFTSLARYELRPLTDIPLAQGV